MWSVAQVDLLPPTSLRMIPSIAIHQIAHEPLLLSETQSLLKISHVFHIVKNLVLTAILLARRLTLLSSTNPESLSPPTDTEHSSSACDVLLIWIELWIVKEG